MRVSHKTLPVRKAPPRPRDDANSNKKKVKKTSRPSMAMSHSQPQSWARPFDWSAHQGIITQLYIVEDLPLKEVEEIMREDFKFHATPKMYKDHFRKWGLRKNLSSQFVEDFMRTRPANLTPTARSPNGSTVVDRNLDRRMNRYLRSGSGSGSGCPNAQPIHFIYDMGSPQRFESPGNLKHAEQTMHLIGDYIAAMDSRSGALGPTYNMAAGKAYHWITLVGIARSFLYEGQLGMGHGRTKLGFAVLNQCFEIFKDMLGPNPWLILAAFYGAYDLARLDPELATRFMRYIENLANIKQHQFHHLFATLRQSGSDGVLENFETVILRYFMDRMAGSFRDRKMVLDIMRSFSYGFKMAFPNKAMPTIEAPPAMVQKAFDRLKGKSDTLLIPPVPLNDQPSSGLAAMVSFPRSPMEDFLQGWTNTRPTPNSPSPSASASSVDTTAVSDMGSHWQGSDIAESPPALDRSMVEMIILNKVVEETSVEIHSGNLSVTARLMDLRACSDNPTKEYSDIKELRPAYYYLMDFYMQNSSIYLPH
ncbi:uncharacterized protein PG986_012115 [Apiospora aurea]|uniref:Clr5 domain-containing protein n=1 Tax=Apiospora aurea TaxID=335848 RepID=A0ABR1PZ36_9PEZI